MRILEARAWATHPALFPCRGMTMSTITSSPETTVGQREARLRRPAAMLAAAISVLYLLIFAGVLSVGRAEAGELGILGVASGVFAVLAILLWRVRSRLLWAGAGLLQVLLTWMYVAIAPERDPSFEAWGLTIRGLSMVLLVLLAGLLLGARKKG
jgi:hypothetical protein